MCMYICNCTRIYICINRLDLFKRIVVECYMADLAWRVAIVKFALSRSSRCGSPSETEGGQYMSMSCNKSQDITRHVVFMFIHHMHTSTRTHERKHTHTHTHERTRT